MNKGIVIHLDNDQKILESSKNLFDQMHIDLEFITCQFEEEFKSVVKERGVEIKALIFDLLSSDPSDGEINGKDAEFLKYVEESFAQYNTPIFIYSGFLEAIHDQFNDSGNVFKIDKEQSFEMIVKKIKLFSDSGFLNVFCQSGILEKEILKNLNLSFKSQFKSNEIEEIISSIQASTDSKNFTTRTIEVFKRIALQSLMFELLTPISSNQDMVNPIEHFYRRNNISQVWTGDIWQRKDNSKVVLILTPRCDLATGNTNSLIICDIIRKDLKLSGNRDKKIEALRKYLTDNIAGNSRRYIPDTPYCRGGFIDFSTHNTILIESFLEDYNYQVTLSDGFANEIISKFASYFLRTGIATINPNEFAYYFDQVNQ